MTAANSMHIRPAHHRRHASAGFSLIEMAMVLIIMTLVLGGLLMPLSAQIEQRNRTETQKTLEDVKEALIGFAQSHGRLPCPASTTSAGLESPLVEGVTCTNPYDGFVPAVTLGLTRIDEAGLALDAWNNRIRYAVPNELTTTTGMADWAEGTGPELFVCASSVGNILSPPSCGTTAQTLTNTPATVFSQGKNWANGGLSSDETSNWNNDAIFISHTPTPPDYPAAQGGEFDDLVTWISRPILYNRMVMAGTLTCKTPPGGTLTCTVDR